VNQNGVWPWREGDRILIPLEQQSRGDQAIHVSVFYSSQIGEAGTNALDLELHAPKFDLPLEDIKWHVYLNEKWRLKKWTGSLQLQNEQLSPALRPSMCRLISRAKRASNARRPRPRNRCSPGK
jgi:hypothetical protein